MPKFTSAHVGRKKIEIELCRNSAGSKEGPCQYSGPTIYVSENPESLCLKFTLFAGGLIVTMSQINNSPVRCHNQAYAVAYASIARSKCLRKRDWLYNKM